MKKALPLLVLISLLLGACRPEPAPAATAADASTAPPGEVANPPDPIYLDPALPVEIRVEDLLARMTLEEKIGQMTLVEKNSIVPEDITTLAIGGLLSGGGGYPEGNRVAGWVEMTSDFQARALATRLGIPLIYGVDAVHGHGNLKGATIFPHNIGLGAAGDPELVYRIGQATAAEMAATGIWWNYAPVVAVPQDIRWGRTYESYSEDAALVSALGTAYLEGLQGGSLADPLTVLGTPKHFIGDGATAWGSSTNRGGAYEIDQGDARIDEATLRSLHLPPYRAAVEAGALSIMISYSSWNGIKMHANADLITGLLKGELGFLGFVVSDWGAIDQVDSNYYTAVVTAVNAGVDMNMVPSKYPVYIQALTAAVENGDVPESRIDDAVRRILRAKFSLGLFERPYPDPDWVALVGSETHRALAREAVRKSLVLLQNENGALPIREDAGVIFVAGEFADDVGAQCGGWTIEWQGAVGDITPGTTILEAVEQRAGPGVQVHYNRFGNYDRILDENGEPLIADIGIIVLGEAPYAEGFTSNGDREDLSLTETDVNQILNIRARVEKLVVILISGRPLIITEQLPLADAWLAAWLPGTEGQGIADALFGDVPFTGRLPFTWPASMEQIPLGSAAGEPLFPFGFGLELE